MVLVLLLRKNFFAEGAYVFITGRRKEDLNAAIKQLGGKNVTIEFNLIHLN